MNIYPNVQRFIHKYKTKAFSSVDRLFQVLKTFFFQIQFSLLFWSVSMLTLIVLVDGQDNRFQFLC